MSKSRGAAFYGYNYTSLIAENCTFENLTGNASYGGAICYASLAIDYYELGVETGKMAAEILLGNKTP